MSVFAEDVAEDVAQTLDVPAAQTVGDVSKQSNNDKRSTYATMSWTWTVTAIGGNYYAKNGSPSSANKYTVNRSLDNSVDHQVGYKFVWDASAGSTAYDGGWQLCMTVDGSVVESTTCYIFDRDMSNVSDTKTAPKSSHTGNSSLPFTLYLSNYPMKKYTYRLTYELNDGSDRYMNKEAVNGVTNTICTFTVTTQEPTRDGYKFLGWADSASATEAQYHAGHTLPTADAPTATREGYTFLHWSREGQTGDVTGQTVNGWTNLYANWERTYSIYYDGNGGTFTKGGKDFTHVSDNDLTLGKPHTLRENVFTREHYEFTGWAKTKEGPKDYDGGATDVTFAESDLNGKGQVRLYAQWKPVEVDVNVYITPVDSGEEDSLLVNDVKLNAATLARIGLKAYETDEDGEAIDRILVGKYASKIAAGLTEDLFGDDITTDVTNELSGFQAAAGLPATFTTNNILGNTTWTCLSVEGEENFLSGNLPLCFVRFATEDEANVTGMPTQEYSYNGAPIYDYYLKGEKVAAPAEDPSRKGYTFDGWYAPGATEKFNFATDTVTGDLVLTAKWVPEIYTITYEYNDKDIKNKKQLQPKNPNSYTIEDAITLKPIEAAGEHGKQFVKWRCDLNKDGVAETITEIPKGTTGNLTISAHWNYPVNYTVFDKNGDKIDRLSNTEYVFEDVLRSEEGYKLTALTQDGYTFDGWYDNGSNSQGDKSPLFKKFLTAISRLDNYAESSRYAWLDELSDPRLTRKLKGLSIQEKELLTKYCIEQKTQAEIASELGLSQRGVGKQLQALKKLFR